MFLPNSNFFDCEVKTRIKVFFLDLAVKARMIEHAFLGRFRDEIIFSSLRNEHTEHTMTTTVLVLDQHEYSDWKDLPE